MRYIAHTKGVRIWNNHIVMPDKSFRFLIQIKQRFPTLALSPPRPGEQDYGETTMQTPLALPRRPLVRKTWLPLYLAAITQAAAAPSGLLNDTGQTRCLNSVGNALEACSATNTGDGSSYPRQDGRFGRDPAAGNPGASGFSKPAGSGGSGGFAFTPLDVSGTAIALTGSPPVPSAIPRCIRDEVTNLIWEVKTTSGLQNQNHTYGWGTNNTGTCTGGSGCTSNAYIADVNALNLCGETANDWRLPTLPEQLSIVDHGRSNPAIDVHYFPNTMSSFYRGATVYTTISIAAWGVDFNLGFTDAITKNTAYYVRLVRNGP